MNLPSISARTSAATYPELGLDGELRTDFFATEQFYLFPLEQGRTGLLLVDGTRIHIVDDAVARVLERAAQAGHDVTGILESLGFSTERIITDTPPPNVHARAFSLAVAQKCNLGCTYCYARGGDFGMPAKTMGLDVAKAAVDRLFEGVDAGEHINLAFMGGEPLANRQVLRLATEYAESKGSNFGVSVGFAITTNGTLVTPADAAFFEDHGFSVTVSLDGIADVHDRLRPFKGGKGSFERIMQRITPLLAAQDRMQVSARVTVTPQNLHLRETLDYLVDAGFHSVGFSPMVNSPTGVDQMREDDFAVLLNQMIDCGEEFERRVSQGQRYPFSNLEAALLELDRGTHRPYPCGAGGGYFGVSAEGKLSACHRFVESDVGAMGSVFDGVDSEAQTIWLAQRHVSKQSPCSSCWARYLCGGGCHHEVIHQGRSQCAYIRGWLHYVLECYARMKATQEQFFPPSGLVN